MISQRHGRFVLQNIISIGQWLIVYCSNSEKLVNSNTLNNTVIIYYTITYFVCIFVLFLNNLWSPKVRFNPLKDGQFGNVKKVQSSEHIQYTGLGQRSNIQRKLKMATPRRLIDLVVDQLTRR